MAESIRILLLDHRFDVTSLEALKGRPYDAIICLFWAAPSTKRILSEVIGGDCYDPADIVGSEMAWGKAAYDLTSQFVQEGPSYGDLRWRIYLTQSIYQECHLFELMNRVVDFVEALRQRRRSGHVILEGGLREDMASLLVKFLSNCPGIAYHPSVDFLQNWGGPGSKNSMRAHLLERLREAYLTGDWRSQAMDSIESMDKTFRWRGRIGRWKRHPNISTGGITFFSSYLNNSRILSSFAGVMPRPVNWVLTNNSSRRGLPKGVNDFSWIWQFAKEKASDRWGMAEEGFVADELNLTEFDQKNSLAATSTWRNWKAVERSLLWAMTRSWEAYLDEARPRMVVMANQWGIEGWFARIARRRNIPVLQVLHGVLSGYLYTQTPILSDLMVVPGTFWRDLWPPAEQHKILVYNPAAPGVVARRMVPAGRRVLTFFSWPIAQASFHNFTELTDGLIHIFHRLLSKGICKVVFRAHPLENPSDFVNRWSHLYGPPPPDLWVSKNEPISHVLSETDVALMFRSTVMLNCLANHIPVVMPGWIDFGWNQAVVGLPNLFLAPDFHPLEQRLTEWLDQPPKAAEDIHQLFVAAPEAGRDVFCSALQDLLSRGSDSPFLLRYPMEGTTPKGCQGAAPSWR